MKSIEGGTMISEEKDQGESAQSLGRRRLTRRAEILAQFKVRLRGGKPVIGMQHSSGSAAVVELLAWAGFDFTIIDMEHSSYSIEKTEELVRTGEATGMVTFVRILENDPKQIMQALETGAQGVLVPHVITKEDARRALASAKYMPDGIRGKTGGARSAYWSMGDWHEYQRWANSEVMVVPIIEDKEAIDHIDKIFAIQGFEIISIGPGDLSQSFGDPGMGLESPGVSNALDRAIALGKQYGISVMTIPLPALSNEFTRTVIERGAKVIWYGADVINIGKYFRHMAQVRDI